MSFYSELDVEHDGEGFVSNGQQFSRYGLENLKQIADYGKI